MKKREQITKVKTGAWSRGLSLARMSMNVGARAAGHALGTIFSSEADRKDSFQEMLRAQASVFAEELGRLKGSVMKAGQMLSVYGEHLLPPEVNSVLKSLQHQSPTVDWKSIEKTLKRNLKSKLDLLEIDPVSIASASIGQVHRATIKSTNEQIVLKVQYPGVDAAIDSDIRAIKTLFSFSRLLPDPHLYEELFQEVRQMLHQEVDYRNELTDTEQYRQLVADDPRVIVPRVFAEFSTSRVLATSFEEGVAIDGDEVKALSQDRRNRLAEVMLDLYFRELFEFRRAQTDPHFGNYRVRLGQGNEPDRLICFDFGAVRKIPLQFLRGYKLMIQGSMNRDAKMLATGAEAVGFLTDDDLESRKQAFVDLCCLITEPFVEDQVYDFGASDLPQRTIQAGKKFATSFKLRPPPREILFLDRKLGGVYVFLSVLKAQIRGRPILQRYVTGCKTD